MTVLAVLLLGGCSEVRETDPARTATEQLLISRAADRAVERLDLGVPPGTKVFVNAEHFEGFDQKYVIGTIRNKLARGGAHLVVKPEQADMVAELRAGALSVNKSDTVVGIRSFDIPIPLSGALKVPEIALWKKARQQGIAKIAVTGYTTKDGKVTIATDPVYGFSHRTEYVVLLLFGWHTDNLIPKDRKLE